MKRSRAGATLFRLFFADAVGKLESRVSSLPTWSGSWKVGFLPCRRGREARKSCIFFADVVGKLDARESSLPTPSGSGCA